MPIITDVSAAQWLEQNVIKQPRTWPFQDSKLQEDSPQLVRVYLGCENQIKQQNLMNTVVTKTSVSSNEECKKVSKESLTTLIVLQVLITDREGVIEFSRIACFKKKDTAL